MRRPTESIETFAQRRKHIASQLNGGAMIVAANPEYLRNHDVHYPYRQDTNLYYLTGFEEPESILVLRQSAKGPESVLFVRAKNIERETWDGFRYGPDAAASTFQIDKVYTIDHFEAETAKLLNGSDKLYYHFYKNAEVDKKVEHILQHVKSSQGRTGRGLLPVHDADEFLGEFRIKKTEAELTNIRKACEISAEAHLQTMKYIRPDMNEREIHGYLLYQFLKQGAAREGYGSIVATGANATTLHYVFNDQICKKEDLLLVDAGAEYNFFTGDITRTYPVGGKFSSAQASVYQGVLDIQKRVMSMVKPGLPFQKLHDEAASQLTDLMLDLSLLSGKKADLIARNEHRKYYPHGLGHYLGMDVHDAGLYKSKNNEPRLLEENMVFTVEPGLYIPLNDETAPQELRGIGIRIEDNVRVTATGFENMTVKAPKEISDLEVVIGKA